MMQANDLKPTKQENGIRTPVKKIEAMQILALEVVLLDNSNVCDIPVTLLC